MKIDNYADEIAKQMRNAVTKAFNAGFQYAQSLALDDNDFVDLGLPSGTKWAKEYLGVTDVSPDGDFFSFVEAQKLSLPTEEQVEELQKCCTRSLQAEKPGFYGPNGNYICFHHNCRMKLANGDLEGHGEYLHYGFWVRSTEDDPYVIATYHRSFAELSCRSLDSCLYKYQVRLVKCSNKLDMDEN